MLLALLLAASGHPPLPVYGVGLVGPDGGIECVVYADGGNVVSTCPINGSGGSNTDGGGSSSGSSGGGGDGGSPTETGSAQVLLNVSGLGNVSGVYQTFFYPSTCAAPWPSPPCVCGAGAYGFGTCPPDGGTALGFSGVGPQDYCTASVSSIINDGGFGYNGMMQATASPGDHDAGFVGGGVALQVVNWTTQTFMAGSTNLLAEIKCYAPK